MRIRIYPYKQGSQSARALAHALDGKVLYLDERSRYRARSDDLVINWGSTTAPLQFRGGTPGQLFNDPTTVALAANKLEFFQASSRWDSAEAREVIVPWTTDKDEAEGWLEDGSQVVVRHILTGRGGQGIELIEDDELLPDAPLYTKYIKKSVEYRVHVVGDAAADVDAEVFDVQMKRRVREGEDTNFQIRNHANGWVYCREDIDVPECVLSAARYVVVNLGLDFGACDVIYNEHYGHARVLEVNTAPGLEGTTLDKYVHMIRARARLE